MGSKDGWHPLRSRMLALSARNEIAVRMRRLLCFLLSSMRRPDAFTDGVDATAL